MTATAQPTETRDQRLYRLERAGIIHPDCPGCRPWYEHPEADPMQPRHNARPGCESGRRAHCSCPVCWG